MTRATTRLHSKGINVHPILSIPLLIVAVPLILLVTVFDAPVTKRKLKRVQELLKTQWIPEKKYLLLVYEQGSPLKTILENDIIKPYNDNLVVMDWDTRHTTDIRYEKVALLLDDVIIRDYDYEFDVALVTIDKTLTMKHVTPIYDDNTYIDIEQKETIELFQREIEATLKSWS